MPNNYLLEMKLNILSLGVYLDKDLHSNKQILHIIDQLNHVTRIFSKLLLNVNLKMVYYSLGQSLGLTHSYQNTNPQNPDLNIITFEKLFNYNADNHRTSLTKPIASVTGTSSKKHSPQ